ncbi:MAG: kynurenine formamidase [Flavobacteriales bacterium]|jgi:arylformamidase
MKTLFSFNGKNYSADLSLGYDLSIPLVAGPNRLAAWYVPEITIETVRADGWVGSVAEGGSVNFRSIAFNPHGHGTHTECLGHITKEVHSINELFHDFHCIAQLITVEPTVSKGEEKGSEIGDLVIESNQIPDGILPEALILRTIPNSGAKLTQVYNDTNPPYLSLKTALKLVQKGVKHLILDLPSVDREVDGGVLQAHHAFWGLPNAPRKNATITELVYIPAQIIDGLYLLNLQTAPFVNDATPSRPMIYKAHSE